jgi:thiamine biosynthesis lipoprotein
MIGPLWLLLTGPGCAHDRLQRHEFTRVVMGVQARIVLYCQDSARAEASAAATFARLAEIEEQASDYRVDNEIATLAQRAGSGAWTEVGSDLHQLILFGQDISKASSGAFDITMGPLTRLWRGSRQSGQMPEAASVRRATSLVDWRKVEVQGSHARLTHAGMALDFGGIAKGYAAQAAVETLTEYGVPISLVSIAGDVFAGDPPPGKAGWNVAIVSGQGTGQDHRTPDEFVLLSRAGCSTSGDVEQVIQNSGIRQSHIIDIRTGRGSDHRKSVTVLAPCGWQSDAIATVLYLLDDASGQKVIDAYPEARAIIYERVGDSVKRREIRSAAPRMSTMR